MKKLFVKLVPIWIFTLCSVLTLFAQTEFSKNIVDTTKQWNEVAQSSETMTFAQRVSNEYTVIDNIRYNYIEEADIYNEETDTWSDWRREIFQFSSFGSLSNMLIREENGKIYTRTSQNSDEEQMIYDFNIDEGDTFVFSLYGGSYIVYRVDSVNVNDNLLKRLYLKGISDENICDEWIEGVGSVNYPLLYPFQSISMHAYGKLLCVKQNNVTAFMNPQYNTCYIPFMNLESVDNTSIKIYPTLVKDNIYVVSDNNKPMDISFVNISGHRTKTIRTNGSKEIDISSLPSGIYNVIINKTHSQKIIKL
jgi:hypothetical protein